MLIYGGVRYTISGGDKEAVTNAKNTILYAVVGIIDEKMAEQISKFEKIHTDELRGNRWNYIYDTVATNTAENFIMAKNFMNLSLCFLVIFFESRI